MNKHKILTLLTSLAQLLIYTVCSYAATTFFTESFEDNNWTSRTDSYGNTWYDGTTSTGAGTANGQSGNCLQWSWVKGSTLPTGFTTLRHKIGTSGTESLYVSFYYKIDSGWQGSGTVAYPHILRALSDVDYTSNPYSALYGCYFAMNVELATGTTSPYNVYPQTWFEDSLRINSSLGTPPDNLTTTSENRSCAGCNGTIGPAPWTTDCWNNGSAWINGAWFDSPSSVISKGTWHHIEFYAKMNTVSNGKSNADGVMQEWLDGASVMNYTNMSFRTEQDSTKKFEEFVIAPTMGVSSPIAQTMYMDELTVGDTGPYTTTTTKAPSTPTGVTLQILP